ncbi:MAG: hypothetical protein EX263_11315 [Flavobacteriaceae bacterium]|nr:MAG: hypothetical protein EX263_11315 [Flavobacteriaceae bacterium]
MEIKEGVNTAKKGQRISKSEFMKQSKWYGAGQQFEKLPPHERKEHRAEIRFNQRQKKMIDSYLDGRDMTLSDLVREALWHYMQSYDRA